VRRIHATTGIALAGTRSHCRKQAEPSFNNGLSDFLHQRVNAPLSICAGALSDLRFEPASPIRRSLTTVAMPYTFA
jgi:hypothetical protein